MSPCFAVNYSKDSCLTNTIFVGQVQTDFTRRVSLTNLANFVRCQFCIAIICPGVNPSPGATFCVHIVKVVGLCAKKEVIWITARGIVALVANEHSFWDGAIGQLPSNTGSRIAMRAATHFVAPAEISISVGGTTGLPLPTVVGAAPVYLFPESLDGRAPMAVMVDVAKWFTFDNAALIYRALCNICLLPTTAVAITVWDFLGIGVRGMICHVDTFLSRFGQSQGHSRGVAWHFLLGITPVSIAQVSE